MHSQSSQASNNSSQAIGPISIPLVRFSYATVAAESTTPIPWTHLSSYGNLFVAFDIIRVSREDGVIEEHSELKIVNGAERLDVLPLDVLGQEAKKTQDNNPSSTNQYSTIIIVRVPCVAIRYPLARGQVRRIQMRFTNEVDYHRALQLLTEGGCPWEPAAQPPARPQSPMSRPSRPQSRPLSRPFSAASTVVNSEEQGLRDIRVNETPRGILSRPEEPTYTTRQPGNGELSAASPFLRTIIQPRTLLRSESSTIALAHQGRVVPDGSSHKTAPQIKEHPVERYRNLETSHSGNWNDTGASFQPDAVSSMQESSSTSPIKRTDIGEIMYTPRPSTAPIMESQGTINRMLPPPRELPFKKPTPLTYSEREQPMFQSKKNTESAALVTPVEKKASNQLDTPASEQALATPIGSASKRAKTPPAPKQAPKRPRTATGVTRRKTVPQPETTVLTVDEILKRDKETGVLQNTTPDFVTSLKNREAIHREASPPPQATADIRSDFTVRNEPDVVLVEDSQSPPRPKAKGSAPARTTTHILDEMSNNLPGPSTIKPPLTSPARRPLMDLTASNLTNYARDGSTTRAERMEAFETFVCEQLENDGFHRLVQDMETWWPRLLMGKDSRI